MPLRYEVFEADKIVDAAYEHEPARPETSEPVVQDNNKLESDQGGQRDMQSDQDSRKSRPAGTFVRHRNGWRDEGKSDVQKNIHHHKDGGECYPNRPLHVAVSVAWSAPVFVILSLRFLFGKRWPIWGNRVGPVFV